MTAQSEGFTRYRAWDFDATPPDAYPLLLHYPYYLLYSSQVVKQADLVFALYVCGDSFTPEQKQRDFAFYEPITVRDSSLSASIQAIVAAEVGHVELAYEYFRETALVDLRDLAGDTGHGIHLASLAGAWLATVAGFGGLRDHGEVLSFVPMLPAALRRLSFGLMYRQRRLRVDLLPGFARVHAPGRRAAAPSPPRSIGHARGRVADDTRLGHRPADTGAGRTSEEPGAITTGRRRRGGTGSALKARQQRADTGRPGRARGPAARRGTPAPLASRADSA